jgi:murein DD-endopeptidase MepM/ murein hydrolase activator NlpD
VDFFKINETGDIFTGDERDVRNFPGFGAPVMAAADGVVVQAVGDEVQDREAMLPRPDETPDQAWERIGQYMMGRMAQDFRRAAAGNIVVIRHDVGGRVEYSAYAHLRAGSLRVRVGQTVNQGEVIGEVGDTGDTTNVHLHFQINAGPDPFASQSLPVTFSDTPDFPDELGRIIVVAPRDQH